MNINEEKLVKLMEEKFITKTEFLDFKLEMYQFRKETRDEFRNMDANFEEIKDKLDDLRPSAKALDKILEQYPIERITRLEKHAKLSPFVPAVSAE